MNSVVARGFGGPDVLTYARSPIPKPGPKEVLIRNYFAGLNYKDVLTRTGSYHAGNPELPFIPGIEACGEVVEVGNGVTAVKKGERVAYMTATLSSKKNDCYAEYTTANVDCVVQVPANVDDQSACCAMVQGLTAHYLTHDSYPVRKGDTVLVQAAAGGLGRIVVQLCVQAGATVIGTCSTKAKAAVARETGCHHVINYSETEDWPVAVKKLTEGKGVDAVFDGVGKSTFLKGLESLKIKGTMVIFGNACGEHPDPLPVTLLTQKGSLRLTRPALYDHLLDRDEMVARCNDLWGLIAAKKLIMPIVAVKPLKEAREAHVELHSRALVGKVLFACRDQEEAPEVSLEPVSSSCEALAIMDNWVVLFVAAAAAVAGACLARRGRA